MCDLAPLSVVAATGAFMELRGKWTKDLEEGYMDFSLSQLQRLYEAITDEYHQVYNECLQRYDDDEAAQREARSRGYEMLTDYKTIDGDEEFATSYTTPAYRMDLWYQTDPRTGKRVYDKGFIRISSK